MTYEVTKPYMRFNSYSGEIEYPKVGDVIKPTKEELERYSEYFKVVRAKENKGEAKKDG